MNCLCWKDEFFQVIKGLNYNIIKTPWFFDKRLSGGYYKGKYFSTLMLHYKKNLCFSNGSVCYRTNSACQF